MTAPGERAAYANGFSDARGSVWSLNDYQREANVTSGPQTGFTRLLYSAAKLAAEGGEACEKIAKAYRDDNSVISLVRREAIKLELGDVIWYVADIARMLDLMMEEIARANIEKIRGRQARGTLHVDGDNR